MGQRCLACDAPNQKKTFYTRTVWNGVLVADAIGVVVGAVHLLDGGDLEPKGFIGRGFAFADALDGGSAKRASGHHISDD